IAIICNLCKKEYSPKTSTQSLMDHISKEYKYNILIKQQTQLYFVKNPYGKFNAIRVKDCINATIDFVVESQMLFSIVGSSWFKKLYNVLDQRYVLPSHQYLQKQIINRFADYCFLVVDELKNILTK
ncbi:12220_t:CDS:1, partial [Funneliformis geosporum]